jgi:hypothetical protein
MVRHFAAALVVAAASYRSAPVARIYDLQLVVSDITNHGGGRERIVPAPKTRESAEPRDNTKKLLSQTTGTLHVEVPESVLAGSGQTREAFVEEAKFLLALKIFELGRLSSSRAADLCGMNRVDFLLRAGQSGTPYPTWTSERGILLKAAQCGRA